MAEVILYLDEHKLYARILLVKEFLGHNLAALVVVLDGLCVLQAIKDHLQAIVQIVAQR